MQSEVILNPENLPTFTEVGYTVAEKNICWICYDDKKDAFIRPCHCVGDLSSVHQECLKRWLLYKITENKACKICKCDYNILNSNNVKVKWKNQFAVYQWSVIAILVTCICLTIAGSWIIIHLYDNSYIQIFTATIGFLVIYTCIRFLVQNVLNAYHVAKVAGLHVGNKINENPNN